MVQTRRPLSPSVLCWGHTHVPFAPSRLQRRASCCGTQCGSGALHLGNAGGCGLQVLPLRRRCERGCCHLCCCVALLASFLLGCLVVTCRIRPSQWRPNGRSQGAAHPADRQRSRQGSTAGGGL